MSASGIGGGRKQPVEKNIDRIFIAIALAYLVVGVGLGIGMGVAEEFAYAHLHAHINLVGFVAHAVFGFAHKLWPALRESSLAKPQLYVTLVGAPVFLIGLPFAQFHAQPLLAIIGSLMLLAGAVLFFLMFIGKSKQVQSFA